MKRKPRNHSVEFKQKAVELTYARGSIPGICRELDIPRSVLGRRGKNPGNMVTTAFPAKETQNWPMGNGRSWN